MMSLVSLATVKAFKNITATEHDAELVRLIGAVDAFITTYCNRQFEQATVTEYHSTRAGQTTLLLKRPPVASITSLHDDPDRVYGANTLIDPSDYVIEDTDAGILKLDGTVFQRGVNNVKVLYSGGFNPVPADLAQAAVELIWLARDKGDQALLGLQSKSVAEGRDVQIFANDWPAGVKAILDSYRLTRV